VIGEVSLTTLDSNQYCVVINPIDSKTNKPRMGMYELRRGGSCGISFFLNPGEKLENGIQKVIVLGSEETLFLRAKEAFVDSMNGMIFFLFFRDYSTYFGHRKYFLTPFVCSD
jgi:major vault protein